MTPEQVAAHIRDPESPLYPTQIGVFCDGCGTTVEHDYLVHEDMDQTARFEVARSHLRSNEGWSCDPDGDLCPNCVTQPARCACNPNQLPADFDPDPGCPIHGDPNVGVPDADVHYGAPVTLRPADAGESTDTGMTP